MGAGFLVANLYATEKLISTVCIRNIFITYKKFEALNTFR